MIEAGIMDGDIVVVCRTSYVENGDIAVALVEDEATVKTFYRENGHFRLQPENKTMKPIITKELYILGKVIANVRYYD
jgi:repressor LexA